MRGIKKLSNVSPELTWPGRARSTLEMDSGHKNKKFGFYPKSLRPFLRILCAVDDSMYVCRRNFSCGPGDLARNSD